MRSTNLARLGQVAARMPVPVVKRNAGRFPNDVMLQLISEEFLSLKSKLGTSSWCGRRRATRVALSDHGSSRPVGITDHGSIELTDHGAAMLPAFLGVTRVGEKVLDKDKNFL